MPRHGSRRLLDTPKPSSLIPEVESDDEAAIARDLSYEAVLASAGVYRTGGALMHKFPTVSPERIVEIDGRKYRQIEQRYIERPVALTVEDARAQNADYYHPGGPFRYASGGEGADVPAGWYLYGRKRHDDYAMNTGAPKRPYLTETVLEPVEDDDGAAATAAAAVPPEEGTADV